MGRVEERPERLEEQRVIEQRVDLGQVPGQAHQTLRDHRLPQGRPVTYGSQHGDGSDLACRRFGAIVTSFDPDRETPPGAYPQVGEALSDRLFQIEVASGQPGAAGLAR